MGQLRVLLGVICAELKAYQVWPVSGNSQSYDQILTRNDLQQNCWFFVSLLQQHLGRIGMGSFILGHLAFPTIGPRVRHKIELIVDVGGMLSCVGKLPT